MQELPKLSNSLEEPWFTKLPKSEQDLLIVSVMLQKRELTHNENYPDYGFMIFSASKAYEGFVKRYLFEQKLISLETYEGKQFRIGRSLNPDIYPEQRDKWWLYDDVVTECGAELAQRIWRTWIECRNRVFHYRPHKNQQLTFSQATQKLDLVLETIRFIVDHSVEH